MIPDFISDIKNHFHDRIGNPFVGPFTVSWVAFNWKPVAIFFLSESKIEEKIDLISINYIIANNLIFYPMLFALLFAAGMPTITFHLQSFQDKENNKRKKIRLKDETEYLRESVNRAEAQAVLTKILAKDEIIRSQQEEIRKQKEEITISKKHLDDELARLTSENEEFDIKVKNYEMRADKNNADARAELKNIELEREKLKIEQNRLNQEREGIVISRVDLQEKLKRLSAKINQTKSINIYSDIELKKFLTSGRFRLFFNPSLGPQKSKEISFEDGGVISAGKNDNENSWAVEDGRLIFYKSNGLVFSRFHFIPDSKIFLHTGDADTESIRGQFIIQEAGYSRARRELMG